MQDTIESLKKHTSVDMDKIRKEYAEVKELIKEKDLQIQDLSYKCQELLEAHLIEVPLTFLRNSSSLPQTSSKSKSQRAKSLSKGQGHSGAKGKLQFIKDINLEVQMMMDEDEGMDGLGLGLGLGSNNKSMQNTIKKNKKKGKKAC